MSWLLREKLTNFRSNDRTDFPLSIVDCDEIAKYMFTWWNCCWNGTKDVNHTRTKSVESLHQGNWVAFFITSKKSLTHSIAIPTTNFCVQFSFNCIFPPRTDDDYLENPCQVVIWVKSFSQLLELTTHMHQLCSLTQSSNFNFYNLWFSRHTFRVRIQHTNRLQ